MAAAKSQARRIFVKHAARERRAVVAFRAAALFGRSSLGCIAQCALAGKPHCTRRSSHISSTFLPVPWSYTVLQYHRASKAPYR
jgi:hypothetical protein